MRSTQLIAVLAIFGLSPAVQAKSLKKMDEGELIEVVENHRRVSKRLDAIEEIGRRGLVSSSAALATRCQADPLEEVCQAVVDSLIQMNADQAREQLLVILRQVAAPEAQRRAALKELLISGKDILRGAIAEILASYRQLSPKLGEELIAALSVLNHSDLADLSVWIAQDQEAARPHRIAALKVAEHFKPPRLWEAWLGMLDDPDSRMRAHCVGQLGQTGLPSSIVVPKLQEIFNNDVEGNVRAQAARSLAFHANPSLLPDLHKSLEQERHPVAWQATLDLLLPLAGPSTVASLLKMLERDRARRIKPEKLAVIVRKLAYIGDGTIISEIYAIEQNHQGTEFSEVCRRVVGALEADEGPEREVALGMLKKDEEIELHFWNDEAQDPTFAPLQVQADETGQVVYTAPE